ncbi:hypothetical protein IL306_001045 [Fusarium sp. DS 682]|nr:hypothetical protein IL306_001045 [Fusarium sp. DS 682]
MSSQSIGKTQSHHEELQILTIAGFLNFSILVGALIGLVTAGPFSDWVFAKATTRNGGIREPEMRLPAMIPYILIMIFGIIASTYAVDCYKPVTGSLFVAIIVNKSLWGYGMAKFVTPWTIKSGFIPVFMTDMGLTVLWCGLGAVFYFYGKTFRRWTKDSNVHEY